MRYYGIEIVCTPNARVPKLITYCNEVQYLSLPGACHEHPEAERRMIDPRTIPRFSEQLWSEEVGIADATDPPAPNVGYRFSSGRTFAATPYDPPLWSNSIDTTTATTVQAQRTEGAFGWEMHMMEQPDLARADYDGLPESVKYLYSFEQYQWLSDGEKARLIQTETEPDQYDD